MKGENKAGKSNQQIDPGELTRGRCRGRSRLLPTETYHSHGPGQLAESHDLPKRQAEAILSDPVVNWH